ncbi:MAG: 2-oxo acid dehydrogenase subunit E2 [Candidatus Helarchaeota archaeon]
MITKLVLPKLGMTMTFGRLVKWLKKENDPIKKREEILEIDTDKVTLKIESPVEGYLRKILVEEKQKVPVGKILAIITTELDEEIGDLAELLKEEKIEEKTTSPMPIPSLSQSRTIERGRIFASPRARKLAREKNVDLNRVQGTGPNGRIIEKDIINYLERPKDITLSGIKVKEILPLEGIRGLIADRMKQSLQEIPQLTLTQKVNLEIVTKVRKEINEKDLKRITITDVFVKVIAGVLEEFPIINSTIEFGEIKILDAINIGVATATDKGLIVPVIKNANKKSIHEISREVKKLAKGARSGSLSLEDLSGGTFTITNLGMFGIEAFTPIINPPESAILGVGKIVNEVMSSKEKQFAVKPLMTLSLTMDHRPFDGHVGAQFLSRIKEIFENESLLKTKLNLERPRHVIEIKDNNYQYDICVIGCGPAGYAAVLSALELGKKVVLIEKSLFGGTCVNKGCIPSQVYVQAVQNLRLLEKMKNRNMGIDIQDYKLNFNKLKKRTEEIVSMIREGIEKNLKSSEMDLMIGEANLKSLHEIEVKTKDGKVTNISSKYVILATGLKYNNEIKRFGEVDFLKAFSEHETIPTRSIIVGSNFIAFELASVLNALGSEVTLLEEDPEYKSCIDEEIQTYLIESFDLQDIEVYNDLKIIETLKNNGKIKLKYEKNEKVQEIEADLILDLRDDLKCHPNLVTQEFLDKFGEIKIKQDYFTNHDNIFVIGDLKNELKLSSLATLDGMVIIQKIYGKNQISDSKFIPISMRTIPEVGCLGLTEKDALNEGYDIKVERYPFALNPMMRIAEEPEGMIKLIADKRTKKLLGVHLIGHCSFELIHEFMYIIKSNLGPKDLVSNAPFHPSFSEMFRDAFKKLFVE